MGANFGFTRLGDLDTPPLELKDKFWELYNYDEIDGGEYSGGWNTLAGVEIVDKQFETTEEAREWLENNCKKWSDALVVEVIDDGFYMGGIRAE
ncbi:MAG: hypothetical protein JRJ78_14120 [Deltaproteobacteria bacterium]|nr:hypothetical protein [Deltaproteobacteria bacterium]